jgi:predicted RNA-binding protein associated with RNAse of E/G family
VTTITVIKLNHLGEELIRYQGEVLRREQNSLILKAFFNFQRYEVGEILLQKGDRFIETYYTDRWYTIYEIYDPQDDSLKGWYCDISYPALIEGNTITFKDLALDLLVYPDGRQIVLDEDEFDALPISVEVREKALAGLAEVQAKFSRNYPTII